MALKSNNRIAVITGGASGIGFAIAKKFVENSIHVILIGRDKTRLKLACETLGELADFVGCDLTRISDLPVVVKGIVEKHRKIDILVNNAGMHLKKAIDEVTTRSIRKLFLQTRQLCSVLQGR